MNLKQHLSELKRKPSIVPVDMTEEWGCTAFVRSLSIGEVRKFQQIYEADSSEAVLAMVCMGLCEEDGTQIFTFPQDVDSGNLDKFEMKDLGKIVAAINNIATAVEHEKKD